MLRLLFNSKLEKFKVKNNGSIKRECGIYSLLYMNLVWLGLQNIENFISERDRKMKCLLLFQTGT